jgi:hypothetical protein
MKGFKLQVAGKGRKIPGAGNTTAGCRLPATSYREYNSLLPVTGYLLPGIQQPVASYRVPVTGNTKVTDCREFVKANDKNREQPESGAW